MHAAEPTLAALPNPALRYFLATRPPFLGVTLFACLIGLATAFATGVNIRPATAVVTVIFALLAHAGINVLNDYYDALNGTDANNTERIFPFTGGSRFIQNGVLSLRETAGFGIALIAVVIVAGLWLVTVSAPGLLWIGVAGLMIGWAYSAPPLKLNSRGMGETSVWAGFALIAVGADYVQRSSFSALPLIAVSAYALLVTNILYINQFPDRKADEAAGKHHWVVRLGPARARWGYLGIALVAYVWLIGTVMAGFLPWPALIALLPAIMSFRAGKDLLRYADSPARLTTAIRLTIGAASLHGVLLSASLVGAHFFG
ncbi:MAG: prenyltransferase [Burkholderiales bacterium]|nr:prenyltransferase [Burkholderiales bacterium]